MEFGSAFLISQEEDFKEMLVKINEQENCKRTIIELRKTHKYLCAKIQFAQLNFLFQC